MVEFQAESVSLNIRKTGGGQLILVHINAPRSRHSEDNSNSGPKNLYEICIKKVFNDKTKECKRFFAPVFVAAGMSSYDLPLPQL